MAIFFQYLIHLDLFDLPGLSASDISSGSNECYTKKKKKNTTTTPPSQPRDQPTHGVVVFFWFLPGAVQVHKP